MQFTRRFVYTCLLVFMVILCFAFMYSPVVGGGGALVQNACISRNWPAALRATGLGLVVVAPGGLEATLKSFRLSVR
jgi:hypothetical protein